MRFSLFMSLYCSLHLLLISVIRVYEIGRDKKENDVGGFEVRSNNLFPHLACNDLPVVPILDKALSPEAGQVSSQLVEISLISMGVPTE